MEPCGANGDTIPVAAKPQLNKICVKCKEEQAVFLFRAIDSTCWECCKDLLVKKVKVALFRTRKNKRDIEKYLVAYSGGASSSALLDVIWNTTNGENSKKKTRLAVVVVHIDESSLGLPNEGREESIAFLRQVQQRYGYEVYDIKLEQLYSSTLHPTPLHINNENNNNTTNETIAKEEEEGLRKIKALFAQAHSTTAKEDLQQRLRSELLQRLGVHLKVDSVLLGTPADRAASLLVVNTCLGRGSAYPGADYPANYFYQPMRDILLKEVAAYNHHSKIPTLFTPTFSTKKPAKSSIFTLAENFVSGLQAEYPHTVHTLLKSEDKLSAPENVAYNCDICRAPVRGNIAETKKVTKSGEGCGDGGCGDGGCGKEQKQEQAGSCGDGGCGSGECGSDEKKTHGPRYCYGCSRMMADFDPAAEELLPVAVPRASLHSMIKDFLIEDED